MAAPPPKDIEDLAPEVLSYSNGPVLLAQTAPLFAIAGLVVVLRCYTRAMITKAFGKDDWAMVAAMVSTTVCFACYVTEISLGVGKYIAVIQANEDGYRSLLRVRQIHMTTVVVGLSLVKISICFFLLRLAAKRLYSWFLWGLIAFLTAFTLACMGTLIFQCTPVAAAWDVKLRPPPAGKGNAKCFSPKAFSSIGVFNGVVNIITDFTLALIPVPLIWKLHMPLRTRVSLVIVLSLAIFAAIAGIIRQLSTKEIASSEPWIHDSYAIWNFIELDVGIIAASLPAIKPMFNWFFNAARNITKGTKNSAFLSRNGGGYQKHTLSADKEAFAMPDFRSRAQVSISTHQKGHADVWKLGRSNNSEDSILPGDPMGQKLSGITVTNRVDVDDYASSERGL